MKSIKIKVGDIVMLKSGGPRMTVGYTDVGDCNDEVGCFWFVGDNKQYEAFVPETLMVIG